MLFCAARPHGGLADVDGLKHNDGGRHPLKKMATVAPGTLFRHPDFPKTQTVTDTLRDPRTSL